jgi:O-antigen/teichoic acid export membrane protein
VIRFIRKALMSQGLVKYLKNTSWLLLEKVLRISLALIIGTWLARYLGPEEFGLYAYILSFVGLFSVFASLGMDSVLVKELVNDPLKTNKLLGTAFYLRLVGATIVILAILITTSLLSINSYERTLIYIVSGTVVFQSVNVIDFYFQSRVMGKYTSYMNCAALFVSSAIKVYLLISAAPLIAFVFVVLFDTLLFAVGYICIYMKLAPTRITSIYFDRETALAILKNTWPIIISTVLATIYMKIDQIMIMNMLGSEPVGQYAAAVRISEAWYFIPAVIATSLFPAIVNAKQISNDVYQFRLRKLYSLMMYMAIAVAALVTFFGQSLVEVMYGPEYQQAGTVLIIHIWAGIFVFLGNVNSRWMINENLQIYGAIYTGIGAITNVGLNYILLPVIGIDGAAFATLVSYGVTVYACLYFSEKTRIGFVHISKSIFIKGFLND